MRKKVSLQDSPPADIDPTDIGRANWDAELPAVSVPSMDENQFHVVQTNTIRTGAKLRMPISDERGVLLLAAGQTITDDFFERLRARNISSLRVHDADLPFVVAGYSQGTAQEGIARHAGALVDEANAGTRQLDDSGPDASNRANLSQGTAFAESVPLPPRTGYSEETRAEMVEHQEQSVNQVQEVFQKLLSGSGVDLDALVGIADEALQDLTTDCDLFAALGLNPLAGDYPSRHCLHTCMLSMSIGTNLKLDRETLKELAVGCLIHDAGMLRIDQGTFQTPRPLKQIEFLEITKHPVRIFDLVRDLEQISHRSAFIAYQMHERNDGSGYPRKRKDNQIHFLSKVAAVADVYSALVAPRCYRPALQPYFAMEQVISMGNSGLLDASAIRALLQTTSMYPLGSYVLLSDGRVARTLRANGVEFDSPVVEAWRQEALDQPPEVIDLLQNSSISIVQAIPRLDCDLSALEATSHKLAGHVTQILDLIDLADGSVSDEIKSQRLSARFTFRQDVTIYYLPAGETAEWKSETFQGRNISRGGISVLGKQCGLPQEVVVVLQDDRMEPVYLQSQVVRRENLRDEWIEFGIRFQKRVAAPKHKPRSVR